MKNTTNINVSHESLHRLKAMSARHGVKQYRLADAAISVLAAMTDSERLAAVNQPSVDTKPATLDASGCASKRATSAK